MKQLEKLGNIFLLKSEDPAADLFVLTREQLTELAALADRKIAKNKKLARKREKEVCRRNNHE